MTAHGLLRGWRRVGSLDERFAHWKTGSVIELEEGTRLVSNLIDVDPAAVTIGMAVECEMVEFDDELTLPQFRPVA